MGGSMSNSETVVRLLAEIEHKLKEKAMEFQYKPNTSAVRKELREALQSVIDEYKPPSSYLNVRVVSEENGNFGVYFDESPVH